MFILQTILGFLVFTNLVVAQDEILPTLRRGVTLFGGAALPTGEMSATSGKVAGFAKTGFVFGVEHSSEAVRHFHVGLEVHVSWMPINGDSVQSAFVKTLGTSNVSLNAGSWLIVGVLGSVGFSAEIGGRSYLYGRGKVGLAFGNTPRISLQVNNSPVTQNSSSASAFAYGFGLGVIIDNAFDFGAHFLSSEPEYTVTTERSGTATSSKFRQPTSIYQLRFGYVISLN